MWVLHDENFIMLLIQLRLTRSLEFIDFMKPNQDRVGELHISGTYRLELNLNLLEKVQVLQLHFTNMVSWMINKLDREAKALEGSSANR